MPQLLTRKETKAIVQSVLLQRSLWLDWGNDWRDFRIDSGNKGNVFFTYQISEYPPFICRYSIDYDGGTIGRIPFFLGRKILRLRKIDRKNKKEQQLSAARNTKVVLLMSALGLGGDIDESKK